MYLHTLATLKSKTNKRQKKPGIKSPKYRNLFSYLLLTNFLELQPALELQI